MFKLAFPTYKQNISALSKKSCVLCQFCTLTEQHEKKEEVVGLSSEELNALRPIPPKLPRKEKIVARAPFAKNFFINKVDTKLMAYPEVLKKNNYEDLRTMIAVVENFMKEEVNSSKIDKMGSISPETMKSAKELGLFGLKVPNEYGGLEFSETESARIFEVLSWDGSLATKIGAHTELGMKSILLYGTEEQKKKYLPRLATGELTIAFALWEQEVGSDISSLKTKAKELTEGEGYSISGTKTSVVNGASANLMVVFASTKFSNHNHEYLSAFLVESDWMGVSKGEPKNTLGLHGSDTADVTFENTPVPLDNVLGDIHQGFLIAQTVLNEARLTVGSVCTGVLKDLLKKCIERSLSHAQFGRPIAEYPVIKQKLVNMAMDIHAMEAMTYFTTGLLDLYRDQDCLMESSIIKVFNTEALWRHVSECIQIFGVDGLSKDLPLERILRDSRAAQFTCGTNEVIRMFIGLSGFQHAGEELKDTVEVIRNPTFFPKEFFRTIFDAVSEDSRSSALKLKLFEYVHPSLAIEADAIEKQVSLLSAVVKNLIHQYGREITLPEQQYLVSRVANAAIEIFASMCVLTRASRSYCVGIHNCFHEFDLMRVFVKKSMIKAEEELEKCSDSPTEADIIANRIAGSLYEKKGYAAEDAITKYMF